MPKPYVLLLEEVVRKVRTSMLKRYRSFGPDLAGLCYVASLQVAAELAALRVPHGVVVGEFDGAPHVWVEVGRLAVDATYGQFNPKVPYRIGTRTSQYEPHARDEAAVEILKDWLGAGADAEDRRADRAFLTAVRAWRRNLKGQNRRRAA